MALKYSAQQIVDLIQTIRWMNEDSESVELTVIIAREGDPPVEISTLDRETRIDLYQWLIEHEPSVGAVHRISSPTKQ